MKRLSSSLALSLAATFALSAEEPQLLQTWTASPYWAPQGRPGGRDGVTPRHAQAPDALPSAPLPFVAITPCRLADTRGLGFTGAWGPPALPASTPRDFPITGRCGIAVTAQAVSFNVTVTAAQGPGMILAYPAGGAQPTVSTVNYAAGQTVANAAIVPLGTGGAATFLAGVSGTDLILDVNGYYAPQGSVTSLNTLTGDVALSPGANVSITPSGNTLTISAAGGGTPTGAAGGSLAGTYPNPAIANGAVSAGQLADGSVGSTKLASNTAVRSINGAAQDLVTLQGAGGVSVSTAGSTITIAPPAGSMVLGALGDTTLVGAGYSEVGPYAFDYWSATTTTGAPSARYHHTAVWTGSRMIVWGGWDTYAAFNDGGQYDPVTNTWTVTSTAGAPSARFGHTAISTGTEMIVWGGRDGALVLLNDGGRYNPVANAWSPINTAGAPSARAFHTAVWTEGGEKMIVWGGTSGSSSFPSVGGRYDLATDTWMPTATSGAPQGRAYSTAIWTGTKMIVWGGQNGSGVLNDGGQYDPNGDVWTATNTVGAPTARTGHTAVWSGTVMIVWGGSAVNDGARYDPNSDTWMPTAMAGAPAARSNHAAVWTGARMVVWGGCCSSALIGGQYDPLRDVWTMIAVTGAPSIRWWYTAVWTGLRMIVWGGWNGNPLNDGGQWCPLSVYMKN